MTQPNKPSWEDAPEWAQYLAQDEDGEWAWFELEPECHSPSATWDNGDGRFRIATHGAVIDD